MAAWLLWCAIAASPPPEGAGQYTALSNEDACTAGGSCNLARHLHLSVAQLHALCDQQPACECHNERWLKSNCTQRRRSRGTTLYMKGRGPFPPLPPPPLPPAPPPPPANVQGFERIWPSPQSATGHGPPRPVSAQLRISSSSASTTVARAIERYTPWIRAVAAQRQRQRRRGARPAGEALVTLRLVVLGGSERLWSRTNYSYTLHVEEGDSSATARCASPYAAAYALETFSQLLGEGGELPFQSLDVRDAPMYKHRGLLLDIGRRYYPLPLLRDIIDGISFSKMSVLHMHFSDFPAFRVQSLRFPHLTAALGNQSYTQAEIRELVEFGRLRGVRGKRSPRRA
jgi:hypothetical protein